MGGALVKPERERKGQSEEKHGVRGGKKGKGRQSQPQRVWLKQRNGYCGARKKEGGPRCEKSWERDEEPDTREGKKIRRGCRPRQRKTVPGAQKARFLQEKRGETKTNR